jgi:hypothetical protein
MPLEHNIPANPSGFGFQGHGRMRISRYSSFSIVAALFALAALLELLIGTARAQEADPVVALQNLDVEQFVRRNPGTLLATIALPIVMMLTVLAHRRHYLRFSILVGAVAGAACQTVPVFATLTASPILARILQSAAAALIALMFALLFDLMFFIARLSRRPIRGKSLRGPDPLRQWFREAIVVQRWAPSREREQEIDDAAARWHIALVAGAGALVAAVVIQGHFLAGVHGQFGVIGFLTTSVILIAVLYILEPLRERILRLPGPGHHEEAARDSLVRMVIESPRQGWLLSAFIVLGVLLVQVLIIGLEEAIQKAAFRELVDLAFAGLGTMPIAYFLCAALQKRLDVNHAVRGTSAFVALLLLTFLLVGALFLGAFAGATMAVLANTYFGSGLASFTIVPLVGIATALILCAILFWLSLGVALVLGFIFGGLSIWLLQVVWPRTRGANPFVYLGLAIVVATVVENLVIAPLVFADQGAGKGGETIRLLITEPFATSTGWLVGLWLSGVAGVLQAYQNARPELFPNLKTSPPKPSGT